MKRITFTAALAAFVTFLSAQSNQVQNMYNYIKSKELDKAKAAADAAAVHDNTKGAAKTWSLRGQVYQAIYEDKKPEVKNLDPEAEEKALDAFITCLKLDKDNIYKDDVKGRIVAAAASTNWKAGLYADRKEYEKALKCYELVENALPFDFDQGMKRANISKEKLLFNRFDMYRSAGNKEKTAEFGNKLVDSKYKDPKLYLYMTTVSLADRDTAKALSYLEKGKMLFDDNMSILGTEIDIYLAQNKIAQLKEKLNKAIEVSPDNEILYVVLGQIHEKVNEPADAEKAYLKAAEIKPDNEDINYRLGALYFNRASDYNKKLNDLTPKDPKTKEKEYEDKVQENFKKAIPFLEKAYEINPDKAYKQRLFKACTRVGDAEKAAKYKS